MDYEQFNRFLYAELELKSLEQAYNTERLSHYRDIRPTMTYFDYHQKKIIKTETNVEKEAIFLAETAAQYEREKRYLQQRIELLNEAVQMLYPDERKRFSELRLGYVGTEDIIFTLKKCLEYILLRKQITVDELIVDDTLAQYDTEIDAMSDDELFDADFYYDPLDTFDSEIISMRNRAETSKQNDKDVPCMSLNKVIDPVSVETVEDSLLNLLSN